MRILLLSILLLIGSDALSQKFLLPYRSGELWGYADVNGNILVEPKYDSVATEYDNSRWSVFKNGFTGAIDSKGNEIFSPIYAELEIDHKHSEYHDYFVKKDDLFGYATMDGSFLLPPKFKVLEVCGYDYDVPFYEAYNFLVSEIEESGPYSLIDTNEVVYLEGITDVKLLASSFYQFKVDGHWGIYDVMAKEWNVENRFDTIVSFPTQYDENSDRIEKEYYFYAYENDKVFLIDDYFQLEECTQELLNIHLVPFDMGEGDYPEVMFVDPIISDDAVFMDLSSFPKDESGMISFVKNYEDEIGFLRLLEKKKRVGLEIVKFGIESIEPEYDAIYAFSTDDYRINHTYFLLEKNSKWGVYGVVEKRILIPAEYDSIVPGRYDNLLEVYNGNKAGAYIMGNVFRDSYGHFFTPEFDRFLFRESARSNDEEYDSYYVYFFEKNGIVCPVTQRGVKLFD